MGEKNNNNEKKEGMKRRESLRDQFFKVDNNYKK